MIIQSGALRPLIALLNVDNPDVQCNACGCMTTLATVGELREKGWSRRDCEMGGGAGWREHVGPEMLIGGRGWLEEPCDRKGRAEGLR